MVCLSTFCHIIRSVSLWQVTLQSGTLRSVTLYGQSHYGLSHYTVSHITVCHSTVCHIIRSVTVRSVSVRSVTYGQSHTVCHIMVSHITARYTRLRHTSCQRTHLAVFGFAFVFDFVLDSDFDLAIVFDFDLDSDFDFGLVFDYDFDVDFDSVRSRQARGWRIGRHFPAVVWSPYRPPLQSCCGICACSAAFWCDWCAPDSWSQSGDVAHHDEHNLPTYCK